MGHRLEFIIGEISKQQYDLAHAEQDVNNTNTTGSIVTIGEISKEQYGLTNAERDENNTNKTESIVTIEDEEISKEQYGLTNAEQDENNTNITYITKLPVELLQKVLGYCSFGNISKIRIVSKCFNHVCSDLLNAEFNRLKAVVLERHNYLKSQLPRRESSRRKHPLSRENDIIGTVHMRLALLNLTLGKHAEKSHGCFFAGEVLDEVNKLLDDLQKNDLNPYKITDELFDLSTMAVEYCKDNFEPVLPQVLCISDFLEKSMHSTEKINSSVLKETHKTYQEKLPNTVVNPAMNEFKKSLRKTTRMIYRTRREINSTKLLIKCINLEITNLENMVYQIKQRQKECKEIAIPNDDVNELLIKLIKCNKRINSCESHLECLKSEQKTTKNITAVNVNICAGNSTTASYLNNTPGEKNYDESIPSSSHSPAQSLAQNKDEKINELPDTSTIVPPRRLLKRKCKVIPSKDLPKKKRY